MVIILLCCIIGLLLIGNIFLALSIFRILKKTTYLSIKDKEFIDFAIDIYIKYANELEINTHDEHEIIVEKLKNIQKKHIKP